MEFNCCDRCTSSKLMDTQWSISIQFQTCLSLFWRFNLKTSMKKANIGSTLGSASQNKPSVNVKVLMLTEKQKWDYSLKLLIADVFVGWETLKSDLLKKPTQVFINILLTILKKSVYCEIIDHFMFIKTGFISLFLCKQHCLGGFFKKNRFKLEKTKYLHESLKFEFCVTSNWSNYFFLSFYLLNIASPVLR